ncbi:MAG: LemA family protein [Bacteroidales bacterium]|nr:LemA family protein [Bacteroidales bacterium]
MKRTLWIYCLIIILVGTGSLLMIDTKNKIIHKGELADKTFEQICISYKKRLSLAKQIFPDTLKLEKVTVPAIQPLSSGYNTNNENSIYDYVKANMHFQRKLDSIIVTGLITEESNGLIAVKFKNNAKEIYLLKSSYHKYAKDYNTFIKQFPRNYYANILNFAPKVYYDID